jgi:hypothetical protein
MESTSIMVIVLFLTPPILTISDLVRDGFVIKKGATNKGKTKLGKAWA